MRIGILGTGQMADALGGGWVRAGHEVMVGGRSSERAAELAGRIGATAAGLHETAEFGDATLLAIRAQGITEALRAAKADEGSLRDRPLIDCTNAVVPGKFVLAEPAVAERIASIATGAHVVKAFNLCADTVWRNTPHVFEAQPLGVPLCSDDEAALRVVSQLVRDLGCTPILAGGLERSSLLEATAALAIGIWVSGGDVRSMVPPPAHAF